MIEAKTLLHHLETYLAGRHTLDELAALQYKHIKQADFFDNERIVRYVVVRTGMIEAALPDAEAANRDRIQSLHDMLKAFLDKGIDPYQDPNPAKRRAHLRSLLRHELSVLLYLADPMGVVEADARAEYDSEAQAIEAGLAQADSPPAVLTLAVEALSRTFDAATVRRPAVQRALKSFAEQAYKLYTIGYPELNRAGYRSDEYDFPEEELSYFQKAALRVVRQVHERYKDKANLEVAMHTLGNIELGVQIEGVLSITLVPHNPKAATYEVYAPGDDTLSLTANHTAEEVWYEDTETMEHDLTEMLEAVVAGRFEEWVREPLGHETLQEYGRPGEKPAVVSTNVWVSALWKRSKRTKHYSYEPY